MSTDYYKLIDPITEIVLRPKRKKKTILVIRGEITGSLNVPNEYLPDVLRQLSTEEVVAHTHLGNVEQGVCLRIRDRSLYDTPQQMLISEHGETLKFKDLQSSVHTILDS